MRPITILVGRNSAGKSTFLRSLPLIRQSLETRSSAPILWFGELVDFGDPIVAIGENIEGRQAVFRFLLDNVRGRKRRPDVFWYDSYHRIRRNVHLDRVSLRYVIGAREDKTVLQSLHVQIPDEDIDVCLDFGPRTGVAGGVTINGESAEFITRTYGIRAVDRNLFSLPYFASRSAAEDVKMRIKIRPVGSVLEDLLLNIFRKNISRNLKDSTIWYEVQRILGEDRFDESSIRKLANTSTTVTFKEIYNELLLGNENPFQYQVFAIRRLARVFVALEIIEDLLTRYFLNVGYLEPVRAASERFYRKQELEVSEIAPNGANFPMFLASLDDRELEKFSTWVEGIFGYGVRMHRTAGHISIHLHSGSRSVNVTDTGYGVSQILPVLGMMWWSQHKKTSRGMPRHNRTELRTLAIEQPELHLHPAHQAKLADVFVSVIKRGMQSDRQMETRLIVETHSEALIYRLGELIEDGKISADAVQIVIFSAHEDLGSPTEVSISSFDETGALKNWPFGFFNYSEK